MRGTWRAPMAWVPNCTLSNGLFWFHVSFYLWIFDKIQFFRFFTFSPKWVYDHIWTMYSRSKFPLQNIFFLSLLASYIYEPYKTIEKPRVILFSTWIWLLTLVCCPHCSFCLSLSFSPLFLNCSFLTTFLYISVFMSPLPHLLLWLFWFSFPSSFHFTITSMMSTSFTLQYFFITILYIKNF